MKTIPDLTKEFTRCDAPTIILIYTRIEYLLKEIAREIVKHSRTFSHYPINKHPVTSQTTLVITELRLLQQLPPECMLIKKHARELITKLTDFKRLVGTPFCNTTQRALELFTEHIYQETIRKIILKDVKIPEVKLLFTELYKCLIEQQARLAQS